MVLRKRPGTEFPDATLLPTQKQKEKQFEVPLQGPKVAAAPTSAKATFPTGPLTDLTPPNIASASELAEINIGQFNTNLDKVMKAYSKAYNAEITPALALDVVSAARTDPDRLFNDRMLSELIYQDMLKNEDADFQAEKGALEEAGAEKIKEDPAWYDQFIAGEDVKVLKKQAAGALHYLKVYGDFYQHMAAAAAHAVMGKGFEWKDTEGKTASEEFGMTNPMLAFLVDFGMETVMDPLTYLGMGAAKGYQLRRATSPLKAAKMIKSREIRNLARMAAKTKTIQQIDTMFPMMDISTQVALRRITNPKTSLPIIQRYVKEGKAWRNMRMASNDILSVTRVGMDDRELHRAVDLLGRNSFKMELDELDTWMIRVMQQPVYGRAAVFRKFLAAGYDKIGVPKHPRTGAYMFDKVSPAYQSYVKNLATGYLNAGEGPMPFAFLPHQAQESSVLLDLHPLEMRYWTTPQGRAILKADNALGVRQSRGAVDFLSRIWRLTILSRPATAVRVSLDEWLRLITEPFYRSSAIPGIEGGPGIPGVIPDLKMRKAYKAIGDALEKNGIKYWEKVPRELHGFSRALGGRGYGAWNATVTGDNPEFIPALHDMVNYTMGTSEPFQRFMKAGRGAKGRAAVKSWLKNTPDGRRMMEIVKNQTQTPVSTLDGYAKTIEDAVSYLVDSQANPANRDLMLKYIMDSTEGKKIDAKAFRVFESKNIVIPGRRFTEASLKRSDDALDRLEEFFLGRLLRNPAQRRKETVFIKARNREAGHLVNYYKQQGKYVDNDLIQGYLKAAKETHPKLTSRQLLKNLRSEGYMTLDDIMFLSERVGLAEAQRLVMGWRTTTIGGDMLRNIFPFFQPTKEMFWYWGQRTFREIPTGLGRIPVPKEARVLSAFERLQRLPQKSYPMFEFDPETGRKKIGTVSPRGLAFFPVAGEPVFSALPGFGPLFTYGGGYLAERYPSLFGRDGSILPIGRMPFVGSAWSANKRKIMNAAFGIDTEFFQPEVIKDRRAREAHNKKISFAQDMWNKLHTINFNVIDDRYERWQWQTGVVGETVPIGYQEVYPDELAVKAKLGLLEPWEEEHYATVFGSKPRKSQSYWDWPTKKKEAYLSKHPEAIPYVVGRYGRSSNIMQSPPRAKNKRDWSQWVADGKIRLRTMEEWTRKLYEINAVVETRKEADRRGLDVKAFRNSAAGRRFIYTIREEPLKEIEERFPGRFDPELDITDPKPQALDIMALYKRINDRKRLMGFSGEQNTKASWIIRNGMRQRTEFMVEQIIAESKNKKEWRRLLAAWKHRNEIEESLNLTPQSVFSKTFEKRLRYEVDLLETGSPGFKLEFRRIPSSLWRI